MTAERNLVESWYDARAEVEEHRLDEGRLEFEVTMRTIESLLSELGLSQAKVLDNGGGPGKYGLSACPECSISMLCLTEM
jgi:S-adenosylmethionine-dependent methyltransferase